MSEQYFAADYFDYIVIDEFHHAVNEQYRRIVDYFKPQFLLGLTATPERMDGRNIYELCDYNVPYEISLKDAIIRECWFRFIIMAFMMIRIIRHCTLSGVNTMKRN